MLILHETYDHLSVAFLTVTVHSSFLLTFDIFFKKYVAFCTAFNLLTPIFWLPYIIMDLHIFVIAEWATLLVDIRCPRGASLLSIPIHLSGLSALMSADITRNL